MTVLPSSITAAITRFDAAAQAVGVMRDGAQPDNHWAIQHQYDEARQRLERAIEKVITK